MPKKYIFKTIKFYGYTEIRIFNKMKENKKKDFDLRKEPNFDLSFEYVKQRMEQEGFDYCFINYSNFEEVKDDKFHELRKRYINAKNELESYIETKNREEIGFDS